MENLSSSQINRTNYTRLTPQVFKYTIGSGKVLMALPTYRGYA